LFSTFARLRTPALKRITLGFSGSPTQLTKAAAYRRVRCKR
jgi:hypothetical protein